MKKLLYGFIVILLVSCATEERDPNIIILLADDLGYGDLSGYGSEEIKTPHLDRLAKSGVKFTNGYAASAVCTPTRASILTGKYPLRYNITKHFSDKVGQYLPTNKVLSLAELLQAKGYRTSHIGKWHLGGLDEENISKKRAGQSHDPGPAEHGFDEYAVMVEGKIRSQLYKERMAYRKGGEHLVINDLDTVIDGHWASIKGDLARDFIRRSVSDGEPFFLNLWFDVPHTPYEPAVEPYLSWYKEDTLEREGEKYKFHNRFGDGVRYNSMVSHMDAEIGKIMDLLKAKGIEENTLIIFTSDNGPSYRGSTGGLTGGKTDLREGGIRVPYIISWPGTVQPSLSEELISTIDIMPTVSDILEADISVENVDGQSLLPLLTGKGEWNRGKVLWQINLYKGFYPQPGERPTPYATAMVRSDNWKLLANDSIPVALFDLESDPLEQKNLIDLHPKQVSDLHEEVLEFLKAPRMIVD